jgi:hypothetical protein
MLNKANPYFGQTWVYFQAIHVAHSAEMLTLMFWHLSAVFSEWEEFGLAQPKSKYTQTTVGLWKMYCTPPWNTWSIGSYDGYGRLPGCEPHDLPGCLPSNQCQESWHKGIGRILKGKLRGSLEVHPHP